MAEQAVYAKNSILFVLAFPSPNRLGEVPVGQLVLSICLPELQQFVDFGVLQKLDHACSGYATALHGGMSQHLAYRGGHEEGVFLNHVPFRCAKVKPVWDHGLLESPNTPEPWRFLQQHKISDPPDDVLFRDRHVVQYTVGTNHLHS